MIKVIFWDIDDTLMDFNAANKAAFKSCFEKFGLGPCTDEMYEDYSRINKNYWSLCERGLHKKQDVFLDRFRDYFASIGMDPAFTESIVDNLNLEYQHRLGDTTIFFEQAKETVEYLKGKVIQCAATNGTVIAQNAKLTRSGLIDLLDHIYISDQIGADKPHALFYEKALRLLEEKTGVHYKPDEILMIGDTPGTDILGGNNYGTLTCWFNPADRPIPDGIVPDYMIRHYSELLPILRKLCDLP